MFGLKVPGCVLALAAAAAGVTEQTSTPTGDANYMVMQGDVGYTASATTSFGGITGRVQMVRSALSALTSFSYQLSFAQSGSAPAVGTVLNARLSRHICSVQFTPYQDPYQCPGYSLTTNTNGCASDSSVEVAIQCTVDANGRCAGSFDWNIYIPEYFEGQHLEDLSLVFAHDNNEFACANFDASRILHLSEGTPVSSRGANTLVQGELERDELGYTHAQIELQSLSPSVEHTLAVVNSPCSDGSDNFAAADATFMTQVFTADGSGNADVAFHISSVATAGSQSVVLFDTAGVAACYQLEISASSFESRVASFYNADASSSDGCSAWANFFTPDAAHAASTRLSDTEGKKGKRKSHKKRKGPSGTFRADLDTAFTSLEVNGMPRCCVRPDITSEQLRCISSSHGKGKKGDRCGRHGGLFSPSTENGRVQTGLGAGIAGAVILAAGIAMHVRRKQVQRKAVIDETTPLTQATTSQ